MEQQSNPPTHLLGEPVPAQYASMDFDAASTGRPVCQSGPREKVTFWRDETLGNLELLKATYITHAFAPHVHEGYAIGIIERGAERFKYRKSLHVAPQGSVVLVNPGEMHTGEAQVEEGWSYRMFYPNIQMLQRAASDVVGREQGVPCFPAPVVHDPAMALQLSQLHAVLATSSSALERESQLTWTLAHLIMRHADTRPVAVVPGREQARIIIAREYLEEHFTENVSLEQLAAFVNLSPFHLLRVFRESVGLPPHSYLTHVRVMRAKRLLGASVPLAEVAAAVGFTDQSHLHRHFKALVGVTPGQYARGSRT